MEHDRKTVVVSGIRATGRLHIGNYFGAIRNFPPLQDHACFFFVADYHTLTTNPDPEHLQLHRLPIVKAFLACGIDPKRATIYLQSDLPETTELATLLSMLVTKGELERCTTFKEKAKNSPDEVSLGLLAYPVLMAADILIHRGTLVPVGEDQMQHLEMTRDFAGRFNRRYKGRGFSFALPKALPHSAIRLPGLDGKKMGKSDGNTIDLLDDGETIATKVRRAITDPQRMRRDDPGSPERCVSVYPIHTLVTADAELEEVKAGCKSGTISCSDCKAKLATNLTRALAPIRERHHEIKDTFVRDVLYDGAIKARESAREVIVGARQTMGF